MGNRTIPMDGWKAHLTVSFNSLREKHACTDGYKKLAHHIRDQFAMTPEAYGINTPIPLILVLRSNGIADALWSLRATLDSSEQFARLLACDFAEHVLPVFEAKRPDDGRPRRCVEMARLFAVGKATDEERIEARAGAVKAAYAAAYATYAAAAAEAATYAAAATYAIYAATYAAAAARAAACAAAAARADAATCAAARAADYAAAQATEKQWQSEQCEMLMWADREGTAVKAFQSGGAIADGVAA